MKWEYSEVASPHIAEPVAVIAAKNIQYIPDGHRFQTLNVYLPRTTQTADLVGQPVTTLPSRGAIGSAPIVAPRWHVHIHGGAWRDPQLTAASIEAAAAHAFCAASPAHPIEAIISINYTLSPFPSHPALPYDPIKDNHSDPSREASHPDHVHDVLRALSFLRTLGLADRSYILSGHSAGGCLIFQSILPSSDSWGFEGLGDVPSPAALLGMNGLYDLPGLVDDLGPSHAGLRDVYKDLISIAFSPDQTTWSTASPARVSLEVITKRVRDGKMPRVVVLDQSTEDLLVPVNQTEKLQALLGNIPDLQVVRGHRCSGVHAAPWEQGFMIWDSIQDVLALLTAKN